ncbi:hypothetical protein PFICI_10884 [Pestalotiopsis fici W106-1]|uniref:Xylanolytic transcriptional activator regulatory domain-containing protein n=1 Tax=Pestalotiopsis fici (strain W106-1 / CGMCC3.15140) TaxID=1229662 RepID=W3WT24_PESFW|nr:uncharacterized protein PFICI_10884 [Pestalotiopsis fici W106-1]ETS77010.1 hypothetical protein PFICI_10884 [Pestalotiopsis fici W106-1]
MTFTPLQNAGNAASSRPTESETTAGPSQDESICPSQDAYSAVASVLPTIPLGPPGAGFDPAGAEGLHNTANMNHNRDSLEHCEPIWPSWADFDVDALNFSISAAISEWGLAPEVSPDAPGIDIATDGFGRSRDTSLGPRELLSAVQANWHTRVIADSPTLSSDASVHVEASVNDAYREGLTQRLHPSVHKTVLPSAAFLNLCVKLYFTKFHPVLPLVHAPTFQPSSENALLLLSICSIGALFIGSPSASAQGRKIFQILNKAVLATWENYVGYDGRETLALTQAAIIGQTFPMLSGYPQDLYMTECFSGTVMAWARQAGFFNVKDTLPMVQKLDSLDIEEAWKDWARKEEKARLILGLYIHDSEFATIFHHEPLLRHHPGRLPKCASEELFSATTATQWYAILRRNQTTDETAHAYAPLQVAAHQSEMHTYASLAGIIASIQETRACTQDFTNAAPFRDSLLGWYHESFKSLPEHNLANLMILWHTGFLTLYSELDTLERAVGRNGESSAAQVSDIVHEWATSVEARRSVLHAHFIVTIAENLPLGLEPAIHVPKALFYSALATTCFLKFGPNREPLIFMQEMDMPEFQCPTTVNTVDSSGAKGRVNRIPPIDSSLLCRAVDLLRRIGHWEISRRFYSVLNPLLQELVK